MSSLSRKRKFTWYVIENLISVNAWWLSLKGERDIHNGDVDSTDNKNWQGAHLLKVHCASGSVPSSFQAGFNSHENCMWQAMFSIPTLRDGNGDWGKWSARVPQVVTTLAPVYPWPAWLGEARAQVSSERLFLEQVSQQGGKHLVPVRPKQLQSWTQLLTLRSEDCLGSPSQDRCVPLHVRLTLHREFGQLAVSNVYTGETMFCYCFVLGRMALLGLILSLK